MCGVFGTIKQQRRHIDTTVMRSLTYANRSRGKQSVGFFDSAGSVYKKASDPKMGLIEGDCHAFMERAERDAWFMCGHTRQSTRGAIVDRNAHPFEYGNVLGSHNGIISAPNHFEVDSEHAFSLLDDHNSDYQTALSDEWGYWTLCWLNKLDGCFYISTHDNQCALAQYRGAWYFSSDEDHLTACLGDLEMTILNAGDTIKFSDDGVMTRCASFTSNYVNKYKHDARTRGGYHNIHDDNDTFPNVGTRSYYGGTVASANGVERRGATVTDPEGLVRDYDEEFMEVWQSYSSQYDPDDTWKGNDNAGV